MRFWAKVAITDGCWNWTASVNSKGYGNFQMASGKPRMAHLAVFELFHGHVPTGLQIDHLCGNKKCVRPDHLEAVTCSVNLQRRGKWWKWRARRHRFEGAVA